MNDDAILYVCALINDDRLDTSVATHFINSQHGLRADEHTLPDNHVADQHSSLMYECR